MANNIDVTPGTGKTIAAEEITAVLYQRVKLIDPTAASTSPIGNAANPLQVSLENTVANTDPLLVDATGSAIVVSGTVTANLGTIDGAATAAKQDTEITSLANIEAATHLEDDASANAHRGVGCLAVRQDTPANTGADGDYEFLKQSAGRLWVSAKIDTALPASSNVIGQVNPQPTTAGGCLVANMTSGDGSTGLTNSAQAIKASAGQLYGWYIYNPNASAVYVPIYNVAAASVTVGTTNPQMILTIPPTSAANILGAVGIEFTNAGFSAAATTTAGGNSAPAADVEANFFYK